MTASAEGRDYSAYQAPLTAADLSGLSFAFTKVTNGLTEIDPHLARNWAVLGSWGKPRGGYHELVGSASATAQDTYYVDAIKANGGLRPGDILAVVASDYPGVTDADVKAWCDKVRSLAGPQHPIVAYTDLDVAKTLVATSGHYDLWVAWPSSSAPGPSQWAPAKWKTWRFWQWGTEGGVDADAFNGTTADLDSWIAGYTGWTFPEPAGLHVVKQTRDGYTLVWEPVTGPSGQKPTGYSVFTYDAAGELASHQTVTGTGASEYGPTGKGLPAGRYETHLWANGAPAGPPHATITVTLTR